jgi:hypothetical protein
LPLSQVRNGISTACARAGAAASAKREAETMAKRIEIILRGALVTRVSP